MDIFISYRRDGAESLAQLLYTSFTNKGYQVFLDVESLRSGKFNKQLYQQIDECKDVIVVLPPNGLDRCQNPDDWFRLEIEHAIMKRKNIIPIMMRNFEFPKYLPPSIASLPDYHGVSASMEFFDAVLKKIESYLDSKASPDSTPLQNMLTEDPNLTGEEVPLIRYFYYQLNKHEEADENDEEKRLLNSGLTKIREIDEGKRGVKGRQPVRRITVDGDKYDIYDVFIYDQKKYAYGLRSGINMKDQQEGVFFTVDREGNCKLFGELSSLTIDINASAYLGELLSWYIGFRRGLGLPLMLIDSYWRSFEKTKSAFEGVTDSLNRADTYKEFAKSMDYETLKLLNKNLLTRTVSGYYRNKLVNIELGGCISHDGRTVSTPIGNNLILDLVPLQLKNNYVALTYRMKKVGKLFSRSWSAIEGPEYYEIMKDDISRDLTISRINDEDIEYACKPYVERFALIYMYAKMMAPWAFIKA